MFTTKSDCASRLARDRTVDRRVWKKPRDRGCGIPSPTIYRTHRLGERYLRDVCAAAGTQSTCHPYKGGGMLVDLTCSPPGGWWRWYLLRSVVQPLLVAGYLLAWRGRE